MRISRNGELGWDVLGINSTFNLDLQCTVKRQDVVCSCGYFFVVNSTFMVNKRYDLTKAVVVRRYGYV